MEIEAKMVEKIRIKQARAKNVRSERKVLLHIIFKGEYACFINVERLTILHFKHVSVVARNISRFSQRSSFVSRFFSLSNLSNSVQNVFCSFDKHGLQRHAVFF